MIFIALSWIYILLIVWLHGVLFNKILDLKENPFFNSFINGICLLLLVSGFWSIFFPLNWQFQLVIIVTSGLSLVLCKQQFKNQVLEIYNKFKELDAFLKLAFGIICLLILAQCASPPFLMDNESYYIQTIKWLNNYGLTSGLINLHPFLGQMSGWHILQSTFNFSFLYHAFNDLNGLILLIFNLLAVFKLHEYLEGKLSKQIFLFVGLLPFCNILFFQFISSPSPDLPIMVFGLVLCFEFIKDYKNHTFNNLTTMFIIAVLLIMIKPTAILFSIFPLVLLLRKSFHLKPLAKVLIFCSLSAIWILAKNIIVTGNILYPFKNYLSKNISWSLPNTMGNYLFELLKSYGYGLTPEQYQESSVFLLLKHWLFNNGLDSIINLVMLGIILVFPFIRGLFKYQAVRIIYGLAIVQMILLLFTSPQPRFYLPFLLIFILMLFTTILKRKSTIYAILGLSIMMSSIPLFFTVNLGNNMFSRFHLSYLMEPHDNSKFSNEYESFSAKDLKLNTPKYMDFFWGTGDLPLPALNEQQFNYFKDYFGVIPQMRTNDLKDGFYSKNINPTVNN